MQLNESQEKGAASEAQRIALIAGPGSGKTRVIVERVKRRVEAGVNPAKILIMTFTNAGADEFKQRLEGIDLGYAGTVHSFMLRLLRAKNKKISVIPEELSLKILKDVMGELKCKVSDKKILEAKHLLWEPTKGIGRNKVEQRVWKQYHSKLRESNLVDYDTILVDGIRGLRSGDLIDLFYDIYGTGIELYVDEYQDSGHLDNIVYDLLPVKNRFFVGDSDQAIYSFRGGDDSYIRGIANGEGEFEVIYLENNYRCGENICNHAQELIELNEDRPKKKTIGIEGSGGDISVHEMEDVKTHDYKIYDIVVSAIEKYGEKNVAVLGRLNRHVNEMKYFLKSKGVKVREKKQKISVRGLDRAKLLLAIYRNPNNESLKTVYYKDHRKLTDHDAKKLAKQEFDAPDYDENFEDVEDYFRKDGVDTSLLNALRSISEGQGIESVDKLFTVICEDGSDEDYEDGVFVGTAHGSKGKEFASVTIMACEHNIFPFKIGIEEEERRLFYVAMTRAEKELHLVSSEYRVEKWGEVTTGMSGFAYESGVGDKPKNRGLRKESAYRSIQSMTPRDREFDKNHNKLRNELNGYK